jgi:nickel/cobalt transporter (NicO) family protein
MTIPTQLTWLFLPTAFVLGAAHALEPGHGKTLVATYLISSKGTSKQAVLLGLTVTLTHTAIIFALAVVALFAGAYLKVSVIQHWLEIVSSVIVVAMGAWMLRARWKEYRHYRAHQHAHEHGHAHDHGHEHHGHRHDLPVVEVGGKLSFGQLVSFGVSGGLLPCPAAMMLLLLAIGSGQYVLGFVSVIVFSAGLAGTLIAIGVAVCQGVRFGERFVKDRPIVHLLPFLSAAFVTAMGLALLYKALFLPASKSEPLALPRAGAGS